ncbi:MAG TPA: hypothetical protein VKR06_30910 [Ktedonosporobacter sp.]|nr:hypothetical protein [Ktedonosporobacter sp.]
MALLNHLMMDIQHAYRAGKEGMGNPYDEDQSEILAQIQQWDYGFLPYEKPVKDFLFELLRTTITSIRQGELSEAESLIHAMKGIIESSKLSVDSQHVCISYVEAAGAYLDYKLHRYDQAMERLLGALVLDEQLERRNPNFAYMHLHRIMLLDNWIRVLSYRQQQLEAVDLAFHILDYLERKIPSLPLPTTWDSAQLVLYPVDALSILFRTVTAEIAEIVTGKEILEGPEEAVPLRDVFIAARHHTTSHRSGSCPLSPSAHDWLCLKQAAIDEDLAVFHRYAARLLAAGPGKLPTLWYATIVEVIILSRRNLDRDRGAFCEEVKQDVHSWRRFPSAWKAIIDGE